MSEETTQGTAEEAQAAHSQTSSREEWADIGRRIERQIRHDLARATGANEDTSWEELGRKWETKVRTEIASAVGAEEEADWGAIGQKVESQLKAGLGGWAGASPEEDWSTIGSKIGDKIQNMVEGAIKTEKKAKEASESPEPAEAQGDKT
jgi:hypothetical protein